MPRGNSPPTITTITDENDPPIISNEKPLTIDLVKLVNDQKTRKGLDYVIQAIDLIKKNTPSRNSTLNSAINTQKSKYSEIKRSSEYSLIEIFNLITKYGGKFSDISYASSGVLVGLLIYFLVLWPNNNYQIKEIMVKLVEKLGSNPSVDNLYNSGITGDLLDYFIIYTTSLSKTNKNSNLSVLGERFLKFKLILQNTTESIKLKSEEEKVRINTRLKSAIINGSKGHPVSNRFSLSGKDNKCNSPNSGSCTISGGKRKLRKSRKVSKKSRKTRRRK